MSLANGQHLLNQREHPVLVKVPVPQVRVFPGADIELSPPFSDRSINTGFVKAAAMFLAIARRVIGKDLPGRSG